MPLAEQNPDGPPTKPSLSDTFIESSTSSTVALPKSTAGPTSLRSSSKSKSQASSSSSSPHFPPEMAPQLLRIQKSTRTAFEKRVWTALCQIPRGRVTTYGLLSAHLGSSPRAVGNALRRNPFAPEVPCHRVVATGGTLGGFKGKWPKDGEGITIVEKKRLLKGEGVRLDEKGKVLGSIWSGFK